jgi:hypothetical protein
LLQDQVPGRLLFCVHQLVPHLQLLVLLAGVCCSLLVASLRLAACVHCFTALQAHGQAWRATLAVQHGAHDHNKVEKAHRAMALKLALPALWDEQQGDLGPDV